MNISLLSNINLLSVAKNLNKKFNININKPDGYGIWIEEFLNPNSEFISDKIDAVFVILDGEILKKHYWNINDLIYQLTQTVNKHPFVKFFISNIHINNKYISNYKDQTLYKTYEYNWNKSIVELCQNKDNVTILDIKELIEKIGTEKFYSDKLWYLASAPFSTLGENMITEHIENILNSLSIARKKCIILDLDNTLWEGVIGEDGVDNIVLSENKEGARFKDFQRRLLEIKNTGVILAICSKNNINDALEVFNHPHMILKKSDFAIMKINWEPKYKNIQDIAQELNIGLDSMVFIDDNPVEQELVHSQLPEVIVAEFPKDTSDLSKFAKDLYEKYFMVISASEEDLNKTKMYIENIQREEYKVSFNDLNEYFLSLKTIVKISLANKRDIPRIAQLTQKTNQFNLTTKRYTEKEIEQFMNSEDYLVYTGWVSDKFGDNGLCLVIIVKIVKSKEESVAFIDTYLMSCRVMCRNIEFAVIDYIKKKLQKKMVTELCGNYLPTIKNKPVEKFYEQCGFEFIGFEKEANQCFSFNLIQDIEQKNYYLDLIGDE